MVWWPWIRACSRAAIVLNAAASRRTSGGPDRIPARVSRSPSPRRRAASASVVIGRLAHRASHTAITPAASRLASETTPISVHSTTIRWVSVAVGRDSTTVPMVCWPPSARIGTATVSRPAAG
jgi:hypothetical protein